MKPIVPKPQRCAIYTRKSTEHNLDLEFNSLDAQREACEAYIKSQAHEGWRLDRRSEREIEERLLPVAERFEAALDAGRALLERDADAPHHLIESMAAV